MESTLFCSNRNRIWLCDMCCVSHRLSGCKIVSGVFKSMGLTYNVSWFWHRMRCYGSIYIFLYTWNERENYGWDSSHFWKTRNIAIEKLLPLEIIMLINYKDVISNCIWNKYVYKYNIQSIICISRQRIYYWYNFMHLMPFYTYENS